MAKGLADKPEIVALSKADALSPELLKQQVGAPEARRQAGAARAVLGRRDGRRGGPAPASRRHRGGAAGKEAAAARALAENDVWRP